jgi:hypothetical protein
MNYTIEEALKLISQNRKNKKTTPYVIRVFSEDYDTFRDFLMQMRKTSPLTGYVHEGADKIDIPYKKLEYLLFQQFSSILFQCRKIQNRVSGIKVDLNVLLSSDTFKDFQNEKNIRALEGIVIEYRKSIN